LQKFFTVIPAKAGIQVLQGFLDPGFRRGDGSHCVLQEPQTGTALLGCVIFSVQALFIGVPAERAILEVCMFGRGG
jgi:hypothetical protein